MKITSKKPSMKPSTKKKKPSVAKLLQGDSVSETISFVIKGKLTPIKTELTPITASSLGKKLSVHNKKLNKIVKREKKPAVNKVCKKVNACKLDTKVQIKTAIKPSALKKKPLNKLPQPISTQLTSSLSGITLDSHVNKKPSSAIKSVQKKPTKKLGDVIVKPCVSNTKILKQNATNIKKKKAITGKCDKTKLNKKTASAKKENTKCKKSVNEKQTNVSLNETKAMEEDLKTKETIEKLLKLANKAIKVPNPKKKTKLLKTDSKDKKKEGDAKKKSKSDLKTQSNQNKPSPDVIKESPKPEVKTKETVKTPIVKTKPKSKFKIKAKEALAKKCLKKKLPVKEEKLLPKRHREASLNALAKVHCLYENESRANLLDTIENDFLKKENIKLEKDDDKFSCKNFTPEVPTRILRCVPGLRAVGKHWDMHDTTSSSDSGSEIEVKQYKPKVKKEVVSKEEVVDVSQPKPKKQVRKRRKNQADLMMDLKDMVVRKRMASLNASAILAASYSTEKRSVKSATSDSYYSSDTESEEFISTDDEIYKKKCYESDVKKEEKLIEVHTTPNKKVAVILNQDTDVTITGVYVNSTTRSTHHEGYCSIAGMQYRISATSHTQTAATAVATETLLQSSSSNNASDNSNNDNTSSSKSYTPLDALSNMQPPPGPGIQHGHTVLHGPPPHVLPPLAQHQVSPRHGCNSAFSSPHTTSYPPQPMTHHSQDDPAYIHGYYQPAGPLITVPHGHGQPQPPLITKSAPVSEASPTSTSPPPSHPPQPPSCNGDSSDSEVIITSVTTGKEPLPPHPPSSYRFSQYPSTPPGYSYSYPSYPYPTPPPPTPAYHHELCYPPNPYIHHKYPPPSAYRRYHGSTAFYAANPQDVYPPPPQPGLAAPPNQQVVTAPPVSGSGTAFQSVPNGAPPALIEAYSGPPPTLVETYQPPPHYYPSAYGPAPPPPCYTHSPSRAIPYINATYQSCPCPMQSCSKNVLAGPLTGDSKRSNNMSSIAKDSMPLPPVALAIPLEPASATGPPSPARGSAGMPPPPSPAGATYQTPPAPTKQESHHHDEPPGEEGKDKPPEKKRKARVGKAMVRSNMQQNTMLLMCNPVQNFANNVKREIESPQEKVVEQKKEVCSDEETLKPVTEADFKEGTKTIEICDTELKEEKKLEVSKVEPVRKEVPEELPPCISTVAENVKVKNMKRKLSSSNEAVPETKKQKIDKYSMSSYKSLIKKDVANIKITNGKRKLMTSTLNKRDLRTKTLKGSNVKKGVLTKKPKKTCNNNRIIARTVPEECKENNKRKKKDGATAETTVDKVIECVVSTRASKKLSAAKVNKEKVKSESSAGKKNTNAKNNGTKINGQIKSEEKTTKTKEEQKKVINRRKSKCKEVVSQVIAKVPRRSLQHPRWSNGWQWEGEPYEATVFLNSDETTVLRQCYPAMRHDSGDKIEPRDCVLLKAGPRKNDLPFVAKIAALWENPEDGEMMMSLLWYYRPEHTEHGRQPIDCVDEVFASRHKDSNSVACIDDKCYVLTFNEYCRYRKQFRKLEEGLEDKGTCVPNTEPYPRLNRQPPSPLAISPEMVFFCRRVYDFRQKRIVKNPS